MVSCQKESGQLSVVSGQKATELASYTSSTSLTTDHLTDHLFTDILNGDRRAIAKAIRIIEDEDNDNTALINALYPHTGKSHRVGITGSPGVGKSTFTNQLVKLFRSEGSTVGVIAIDPTSPFTGGAIFGDRLRMDEVAMDKDVFIRSMGTRGSHGGMARKAEDAADILDAAGKDVIIYETVGVGQVDLEIMSAADTVVVITVPEAGDIIQSMKAGLMEIGDIFVVNKSDISGADRMKADIEYVLKLKKNSELHNVHLANSLTGTGIKEIFADICSHFQYLKNENILKLRRMRRSQDRIRAIVNETIVKRFWTDAVEKQMNTWVSESENRTSPNEIARRILMGMMNDDGNDE